jgi:hypothetical protein
LRVLSSFARNRSQLGSNGVQSRMQLHGGVAEYRSQAVAGVFQAGVS